MLSLPTSWKQESLKQPQALVYLVTAVALAVGLCISVGLTLHSTLRRQQHGDRLALALATLEARALNDVATTNRTIAATYVAMNHARASSAPAPSEPLVATLDEWMEASHSSQCAAFAMTFGATREGVSHEAHQLREFPPPPTSDLEKTLGTLNAAEFARAMDGVPCVEWSMEREDTPTGCARRRGCFMKFRVDQDAAPAFIKPRVYSYVDGPRFLGEEDAKDALFMAHVGSPLPAGARETNSMFAPSWRAMLPEDSGMEADAPSRSEDELEVVRRATQGMPSYKGHMPGALAADYLAPGARIAVAWFTTRDSPDEVLDFYRAELGKSASVLAQRYNLNAGYVGYQEPESRRQHLVSVLAQGAETTVLISSTEVESIAQAFQGKIPPEVPSPLSAQSALLMRFQGEERDRVSGMVEAPQSESDELESFYLWKLSADGWRLEHPVERQEGQVMLSAQRGKVRVSLFIQPRDKGARLFFELDRT